jgi:hypothetical protein
VTCWAPPVDETVAVSGATVPLPASAASVAARERVRRAAQHLRVPSTEQAVFVSEPPRLDLPAATAYGVPVETRFVAIDERPPLAHHRGVVAAAADGIDSRRVDSGDRG